MSKNAVQCLSQNLKETKNEDMRREDEEMNDEEM